MIEWMKQKDFWNNFEKEYKAFGRYLKHGEPFEISMPELRARIKEAPIFCPDEGDMPGPIERWYGKIESHLFIITHYYHHEMLKLSEITCEDSDEAKAVVLKALNELKKWNPYI